MIFADMSTLCSPACGSRSTSGAGWRWFIRVHLRRIASSSSESA